MKPVDSFIMQESERSESEKGKGKSFRYFFSYFYFCLVTTTRLWRRADVVRPTPTHCGGK